MKTIKMNLSSLVFVIFPSEKAFQADIFIENGKIAAIGTALTVPEDTEVIDASGVEQMLSGEWDLSLFTCTTSGSARHTVRCKLVPEKNPWMQHVTDMEAFLGGGAEY